MQFLSRYNRGVSSRYDLQFFEICDTYSKLQPIPSENKALARTQTGVLRHLAMLMGYNSVEKIFFNTPSKIRSSPAFNSFMANLPQVVDQNFKIGASVIPLSLTIMHFAPAPNKAAGIRPHPFYSLWYLEAYVRRYWLNALIVMLYKVNIFIVYFGKIMLLNLIHSMSMECFQCRVKYKQ